MGAASVQLGPRALTLAAQAKHELGVPYGKISRWFESAFGLRVSWAAWARADQRLARRGAPVYLKLIDLLRQSHSVAVDETGWKVAGQLAHHQYSEDWPMLAHIRKEDAVTGHLPKGITGHRRTPGYVRASLAPT